MGGILDVCIFCTGVVFWMYVFFALGLYFGCMYDIHYTLYVLHSIVFWIVGKFGQGCILDVLDIFECIWVYFAQRMYFGCMYCIHTCFAQGCTLDSNLVYFGCMYGPPGSEVRVFSNVCCWGVEGLLAFF